MQTHLTPVAGKEILWRSRARRWGAPARVAATIVFAAALLLLSGCSIHETKTGDGQAKKVDIETPFGGIHVNANDVDPKTVGIPVYPGAELVPAKEHDGNSANVNINSALFGLKVVALKYKTSDPPEKVIDFYRDKLKTYGNVLECKGEHSVTNTKPGESRELTCGKNQHGPQINLDSDTMQLKVGTTDRQHVVEVKQIGTGSEIGLVYVQTRGKGDSM